MFDTLMHKFKGAYKKYPKTVTAGAFVLLLAANVLGGFLLGMNPLSILIVAGIGLAVTAGAIIGLAVIGTMVARLFGAKIPDSAANPVRALLAVAALLSPAIGSLIITPYFTPQLLGWAAAVSVSGLVGLVVAAAVLAAVGFAAKFIYDKFFTPGPDQSPLLAGTARQSDLSFIQTDTPATDQNQAKANKTVIDQHRAVDTAVRTGEVVTEVFTSVP